MEDASIRHNDRSDKDVYLPSFNFGSVFSSVFGFGTIEMGAMVAIIMLVLQEYDYVWKFEIKVKTSQEHKERLLFTLRTDWI